jgi:hypothetical protein
VKLRDNVFGHLSGQLGPGLRRGGQCNTIAIGAVTADTGRRFLLAGFRISCGKGCGGEHRHYNSGKRFTETSHHISSALFGLRRC